MTRGSAYSRVCIRAGLHPGGVCISGCLHPGGLHPGESASWGGLHPRGLHPGGLEMGLPQGVGQTPLIMTSSGGHIGRHPTGMHSCC